MLTSLNQGSVRLIGLHLELQNTIQLPPLRVVKLRKMKYFTIKVGGYVLLLGHDIGFFVYSTNVIRLYLIRLTNDTFK